jgi:hypothetical protein
MLFTAHLTVYTRQVGGVGRHLAGRLKYSCVFRAI